MKYITALMIIASAAAYGANTQSTELEPYSWQAKPFFKGVAHSLCASTVPHVVAQPVIPSALFYSGVVSVGFGVWTKLHLDNTHMERDIVEGTYVTIKADGIAEPKPVPMTFITQGDERAISKQTPAEPRPERATNERLNYWHGMATGTGLSLLVNIALAVARYTGVAWKSEMHKNIALGSLGVSAIYALCAELSSKSSTQQKQQ